MNAKKYLVISAVIVLLVVGRQPIGDFLKIVTNQEAVSAYLKGFGPIGPMVLFLLLIAQVFLALIPGHALMVTAGYVYGPLGIGIVIASTVIGSQLAFLIARAYGRGLIYKLASAETIDRWDKIASKQGILFYFFSFVLPIFPSDMMCYVAGLATIPARRFLVSNILGRTCCAVFVTLIGIYEMHPPLWFWVAALLGFCVFFVGWLVYKRAQDLETSRGLEAKYASA